MPCYEHWRLRRCMHVQGQTSFSFTRSLSNPDPLKLSLVPLVNSTAWLATALLLLLLLLLEFVDDTIPTHRPHSLYITHPTLHSSSPTSTISSLHLTLHPAG